MLVAQNLAEKIDPADYEPTQDPEQKKEQKPVRRVKRQFHIPRGQCLVFTGLVMAAFIVGSLISFYYAQIFTMGYKMYSIEKELSDIKADSQSLDVEITSLASLDRVEVMATRKLGMVEPGRDVVMVDADLTRESNTIESGPNVEDNESAPNREKSNPDREQNWVIQTLANLVGYMQQR